MIPDPIVEEVRIRADIVEVIGEHVQLKRAGKEFKALCPFHHEKTPSFYVVPAKGFFKCFGCGESGDVFSFLMKHLGQGFTDAVRQVAAKVGVDIPDTSASRPEDDPNRVLYEAVAFAEDFFRRALVDDVASEPARQYLARREVPAAAIERFRIGYAPGAWRALREAAHRHDIGDDVLLAAGLIKESERSEEPFDRFRDRIIFPIAEPNDRTVAFGGRLRVPSEGAPKYLNSPETAIYHKSRILYGLNWSKGAIRREGAALVVEGYMDYVALAARGVEHVVAGLGTALTVEQANLIARYAGKAYLLYDSDTAGLRATFRGADALLRVGVHPIVVSLPTGEDPDSLMRKGDVGALRALLDAAVDVLEKKLQILTEHGYLDDIEGKRRALDRLLPTLRAVVDPALRDLYLARVEERTGVRRETLEHELAESGRARPLADAELRRSRTRRSEPGAERATPLHRGEAERLLLLLMLRDPTWIGPAAAEVRAEELQDPVFRELFEAVLAVSAAGLPEDGRSGLAAAVGERVSGPAAQVLAAVEQDDIEIADGDRTFSDVVAEIKAAPLFLRLEQIDRQLQAATETETSALIQERSLVNRALSALGKPGFKFSPRYRRYARATRSKRTPSTDDV